MNRPTIPVAPELIPWITADQMKEVDRAMIENFGIGLVQMMENAGRNLAHLCLALFPDIRTNKVVVLAGAGGNGGGALVAARYLHIRGCEVQVVLSHPSEELSKTTRLQYEIVVNLGISLLDPKTLASIPDAALVVDGLIGYGLQDDPHGITATLIDRANEGTAPIISLDIPSGLHATTGRAMTPAIRATATMTLALPKTGLQASKEVGDLYLADLGVPPQLYAKSPLGLTVPHIFGPGEILRVHRRPNA